jgi:hypothetical protein
VTENGGKLFYTYREDFSGGGASSLVRCGRALFMLAKRFTQQTKGYIIHNRVCLIKQPEQV